LRLKIAGLGLAALLPLVLPLQANANNGGTAPCIKMKKEISIDGGVNYYDANTPSAAVTGTPPKNAHYRLTVRNCGATALAEVKVSDPTLGLFGVKIPGNQQGRLAPGHQVMITSRSTGFRKLYQPRRCTKDGIYANVASAKGRVVRPNGVVTGTIVRDDDPAYLICKSWQPAVSIEKQVRLPGGQWVDADTADEAVVQTVGAGVEYRIRITNVGSGGLTNIRVSDTNLAIQNALASKLLWSRQSVTVTAAKRGFENLSQIGRCTAAGDLLNTATVTASARSNPALVVSAQDPAWVKCEPVVGGNPAIEIKKQISFDNATWSDADTLDNPLQGTAPQDVFYRLLITNTGDETLGTLSDEDADLGLNNTLDTLLTLPPNGVGTIELVSTVQGFEALEQPDRCTAAGTVTNTARVSATSQVDGAPVSDDDAAILVCFGAPEIDLQKQVSVDGGTTWADADTDAEAAAATVGNGVQYRFLIENVGTQDIDTLSISDPSLGLADVPVSGYIPAGDTLTVTAADTDFGALDQADRCAVAGDVTNTATISGTSAETNTPVSDTDSAVVRCEEPANPPTVDIRKQVSIDGGTTWLDADTSAGAAVTSVGSPVKYRLLVENTGGEAIINAVVNDPTIGLSNASVFGPTFPWPPGAEVTLDASVEDFEALDQPNGCATAGDVTNTATVSGTSAETNTPVTDTDSAVVRCEEVAVPATCTVCSGLACIFPDSSGPAPTQCGAGNDVCTIRIEDTSVGRLIDRACAVRATAVSQAAQNPPECAKNAVEEGQILGRVCFYVCDGVSNPNCNDPPSLFPLGGDITP
jgi:hypothetical protein